MARVFVGIGANLGDAAANVRSAIDALAASPDVKLIGVSSLYRTAPVGYVTQPDFINAVALVETRLSPRALLAELHSIEARFGRARSFEDAPRTLDLDLLLYDDLSIDEPGLRVPHPRLHERAFALAPLVEIDPACVIPGLGPARTWLAQTTDQRIERLQP